MSSEQNGTTEAEAKARRDEPWVWSMEPPDISAAQERRNSIIRARVRLGELWWNPASEQYEEVQHVTT